MNSPASLTPSELKDFLLNVAIVRPVFIWGPPGVGKSSIVEEFARELGMECVSVVGSQLVPEDLIGVPQIVDGKSRFCPPTMIARDEPFVLFLDELPGASHEVQKAFYSLIQDRRLGEYVLPKGSIVIGAGNRAQDSAIVKQMASPLINRMVHVQISINHRDWLEWAGQAGIHEWVLEYIQIRPDHLFTPPPKHQEPFSTPRSWHMLSDSLKAYKAPTDVQVDACVSGTLTPSHAKAFLGYVKTLRQKYAFNAILKGEAKWPAEAEKVDILHFLAMAFRTHLIKNLPKEAGQGGPSVKDLAHQGKGLLKDLAAINLEIAQLVVASDDAGSSLPNWYLAEIARDLPRLVQARKKE